MKTMYEYQKAGIEFALKHKNVIIADEMGLGKTVQAIGYINANPSITTCLIICPKSLKINWWRELENWLNEETKKRVTINVVHYESLGEFRIPSVDLTIIDEAQYIKNNKTARYVYTKEITKISKHVIMLTGTPFDNKPVEIWPLLQILAPERWDPAGYIYKKVNGKTEKIKVKAGEGANFFSVAKAFFGAKQITIWKKNKQGKAVQEKHWEFNGISNIEWFQSELKKSGFIRRLKKDVLQELPDKIRQIIVLENDKYKDESSYIEITENNFEDDIKKLTTNKIAFTEWSKQRAIQGKAKIDYIVEHVNRCIQNGVKKIILFAYHKEVIQGLAESLVWQGCSFMTAEMTTEERQNAVDVFNQDPNCKIIIGSINIMGTGWTMVDADIIIFGEIDPVPGKMLQSEDRAHRIGRIKENLLIQYLVFDGTLEARICKILAKKLDIINKVLG